MEENKENLNTIEQVGSVQPVAQTTPVAEATEPSAPAAPTPAPTEAPAMEVGKKGTNKTIVICALVFVLAAAVALGGFFNLRSNSTTQKFLKSISNEITKKINFSEVLKSDIDLTKGQLISNGTYGLSSTTDELKAINGLSITADTKMSLDSNNVEVNLKAKQNDATLDAKINYDGKRVYINAPAIYSTTLSITPEGADLEDAEETLNQVKSYMSEFKPEEIDTMLKKLVEYGELALEEAKLSTSYDGMYAVYTITIDKDNASKVKDKFKELISKDETLKKLIPSESSAISKDVTVHESTLKIKQHMLKKNIDEITITSGKDTIVGKKDANGVWVFKQNDKTVMTLQTSATTYTIEAYDEGNKVGTVEMSKDFKKMNYDFKENESSVLVKIDLTDKKSKKLDMDINTMGVQIKANIVSGEENKKITTTGNIKGSYQGIDLAVTINQTVEQPEGSFAPAAITNYKDVNSLTEEDQQTITANAMTVFSKFPIFESMMPTTTMDDTQTIPDMDTTQTYLN